MPYESARDLIAPRPMGKRPVSSGRHRSADVCGPVGQALAGGSTTVALACPSSVRIDDTAASLPLVRGRHRGDAFVVWLDDFVWVEQAVLRREDEPRTAARLWRRRVTPRNSADVSRSLAGAACRRLDFHASDEHNVGPVWIVAVRRHLGLCLSP